MRWSSVVVAVLGGGLVGGCQLLVTFESLPEGAGGSGAAATGGAASTGGPGGSGGAGAATTTGDTTSAGGAPCTEECCSDLDCPAPADPCKAAVCSSGQCVEEPVPEGADTPVQITGDCTRRVCQAGAAVFVADPADVFDDGNECTVDSCVGSDPKSSTLNSNTQCALGAGRLGVCDGDGNCVKCTANAHCPPDWNCETKNQVCESQACNNNQLDGSETDLNCGGPDCAPCDKQKKCQQASDCWSGVCVAGTCADPTCQDGVKNDNESDVDCGGPCPDCGPGQRCNGGGDCTGNQCTGQGGVCVPNCQDGVKNGFESDVDCGGGACPACHSGMACGGLGANCLSGVCGPAGTCEPGDLGTPCSATADCLSTYCSQNVCCDAPCTAGCKSCKLANSVGTCQNVPAGQDPKNACIDGCNGNGSCQ